MKAIFPTINYRSNSVYRSAVPTKKDNANTNNKNSTIKIGYINDCHGQLTRMEKTILPLKNCDILLSSGDSFLGVDKNINKGVAKFLNIAGYEATAVGNHELDMDEKTFYDITKDSKTKFVVTNYRQDINKATNRANRAPIQERFTTHYIKEINGQKYGLVGVSPIDINDRRSNPENYDDCTIDDLEHTIQDIQKDVDDLKKQGVNKIILLSHLGYKLDKDVAKKTSDIDIILGGHSHDLVQDIKTGENLLYSSKNEPVIITNAGRDGEHFGELNIEFDNNGLITKAQNNVTPTDKFGRNLVYQKIIEKDIKNEVVGLVKSALPAPKDRLTMENPHANFVADAMRHEMNADIALVNNANIRSPFNVGTVTSMDAKFISPFANKTVVANITEKDLVDAIKITSRSVITTRPGFLASSGIKYTISKKDGKLLSMTKVDDSGKETPIDINNPSTTKTYKVVADSFVMQGRDGMTPLNYYDKAEKIYDFDKDKLVCDYIKKSNKPIEINQIGRINLV